MTTPADATSNTTYYVVQFQDTPQSEWQTTTPDYQRWSREKACEVMMGLAKWQIPSWEDMGAPSKKPRLGMFIVPNQTIPEIRVLSRQRNGSYNHICGWRVIEVGAK